MKRELALNLLFIVAIATLAFIPSSIYNFQGLDDLPLHPLVIHLTIVLIPLVALFIILSTWSKLRIRRVIILFLLFLSLASAIIANRTGEALSLLVGYPVSHAEAGERVVIAAAILFLGYFLIGRRRDLVSKIIITAISLATLPIIYFAGHSGAELVWKFKYESGLESISLAPNSKVSVEQVREKNVDSSCWTIIDGKVYDLTTFFFKYPGERSDVTPLCGIDGSDLYRGELEGNKFPREILKLYQIGKIQP
jgi:uncharacterized membrane protein